MENTETTRDQLEFEDIKSELDAIVQSLDGYYKDVNLAHVPDIVSLAKSYGIYDNLYKIYEVSQDKDIPGAISVEVAKMGGAAAGAWAGMQLGANIPVLIPQAKGILIILGGAVGAFAGEQGVAQLEDAIRDLAGDMLNDARGLLAGAAWDMADAVGELFNAAMQARYSSPLTLDLDGDGVETVGIDINHLILFDNNNDGIKTATGWVKSDDALLVLDRNGNGTIDNGSELFGDNTWIYDSNNQPTQKAANGFDALAQYDTDKNGKIDETDSIYINLKIWQDYNQDGISQINELSSLNTNAITSIGLTYNTSTTILNNNLYALNGTYQKDNTTQTITDVYFIQENFYREFTDTIPLTEAASVLPEMQGSGLVRDLREAASMQTTEGYALADLLTQYSSLTTHDEQMEMIDTLIKTWGATSGFKDIATEATQHGYTLTINLNDEQFAMLSVLEQFNGRYLHRMPWESAINVTTGVGMSVDETTKTISIDIFNRQLSILEQAYQTLVESVYTGLALQTRLAPYLEAISMNIDENGLTFDIAPMMTKLETLQVSSPRDALIDQLELIEYVGKNLSMMGWNWSETLQTMITQIGAQVDVKAVFSELGYMNSETSNIIYDVEGKNQINYYGDKNIILVGLDGNDTIYSGYGNDFINGGRGNDYLDDKDGNDTYIFNLGDGQDMIYDNSWNTANKDTIRFGKGISSDNLEVARSGDNLILSIKGTTDKITIGGYFMGEYSKIEEFVFNDGTTLTSQQIESIVVLLGTDSNDTISGFATDDVIVGGRGDDYLDGQDGNDTYIFNLGDGQDTVYDNSWNTANKDTIRFGEGISSDNLEVTRDNSNLIIGIKGTTDKITINDYFMSTSSKIEEFAFHDGTTLTSQQIESMVVLRGTDGNDRLSGYETNDVIVGGKGDDYLDGQGGSDTYIFNLGDGQDIIYDSNWGVEGRDIISFGNGIQVDDLSVIRKNYDLVVSIKGTQDSITITDWYMGEQNKIELITFSDGGTLSAGELEEMAIFIGTDGDDNLYGYELSDRFLGGKGNDVLDGQSGDDTYIFNLGDGQDIIYDYSGNNKIVFGEGISSNNLEVTRDNSNLIIGIKGTADKIIVSEYFMSTSSKIEEFAFHDETTLTSQQIESMVAIYGTDGNDSLYGYETNDVFIVSKGQDTIYDYSGNDKIVFNEGISSNNLEVTRDNSNLIIGIKGTTDKIIVSEYFMSTSSKIEEFVFNDGTTLTSQQIESMVAIYGTDGNDSLYGYEADDVFIVSKGQDIIYDYSGNDKIVFGEGISSNNLEVTRDNSNLIIGIKGTADKIIVSEYFMSTSSKIEEFAFHDGTTLTSQQIESMVILRGTDGNDSLSGYETNDVIVGGKGNDYLDGQDGNDTYIFNLGDGQDTIYDYSTNTGNKDIIRFTEGISISDLEIVRDVNNLIFSVIGTNDKITVNEWYSNTQNKIEQFRFADGTIFTSTQVQKMLTFLGTDNNDTLIGTANSDILKGFAGDDTLTGGAGADKFYGGSGNDIYVVDNIYDSVIENLNEGTDTVKSNITYTLTDNVENLTLTGTALINGVGNDFDNIIIGNSVVNTLSGAKGNDTLDGKAGADTMMGGLGDDTYFVDNIEDVIIENVNEGVDKINSKVSLTLADNIENITLTGTSAINATGNVLDNNIFGNSGKNIINGGKGDDTLTGGAGNDTYIFNLGDGQDTISDYGTSTTNGDILKFGDGVVSANVTITRDQSNLYFTLNDTEDKITIASYFDAPEYQIEQVTFTDGTLWNSAMFNQIL